MPYDKYYELLYDNVEVLVNCVLNNSDFHKLITSIIKSEQNENDSGKPWSLLPLIVCESIPDAMDKAIPAAAMMYLLNAAAELFDDIEDADVADSSLARRNPAVAVNAATAMVIIAQQAITLFQHYGIDARKAITISNTINSYYALASSGQHIDLVSGSETSVSEESYLNTTYLKSAGTIECACYAGALSADTSPEISALFRRFGYHLGMSAQIANDLQGIIDGRDIISRKKTLPIIFTLLSATEDIDELKDFYFSQNSNLADTEKIKQIIFSSGGMHYAMVKMAVYKQNAQKDIQDLSARKVITDKLKRFLD